MLLTIAGILLVLWIIGLIFHLFGGLIYIALFLAVVFAVWHFVTGGSKKNDK
jgi:hypothetical protein